MLARRLTGSLLPHGVLVPDPYQVSVGVGKLGPIAPVGFLRAMGELDSPCGPVRERGIDVGNLKPQSALVRRYERSSLLKEDRGAAGVLERDRLPVWNLEFNLQTQRPNIPVAGSSQVSHRNSQMVELDHLHYLHRLLMLATDTGPTLPSWLIPHRHRPRAELQPAHELQVDMLRQPREQRRSMAR